MLETIDTDAKASNDAASSEPNNENESGVSVLPVHRMGEGTERCALCHTASTDRRMLTVENNGEPVRRWLCGPCHLQLTAGEWGGVDHNQRDEGREGVSWQ